MGQNQKHLKSLKTKYKATDKVAFCHIMLSIIFRKFAKIF